MRRIYTSQNYNWIFNKKDGEFIRWGKTTLDDPRFSPVGPEILDIEISTICHGPNGIPCPHCYKSNNKTGINMTLQTYKKIFDKFPSNLTQVAFGIGDIDANPDLWDIMRYTKDKGVIPNITINGSRMIPEYYDNLVDICGAVAVSKYKPKDICYNAVDELLNRGLKQVNIHMLVSQQTYDECFELLNDRLYDIRLEKMNAIVFLMLKPKGYRNYYSKLSSLDKFKKLIDHSMNHDILIGFDSCSAPMFLEAVKIGKDEEEFKKYVICSESCESGLFSSYCNVKGEYWHCSFSENVHPWKGINILKCKDFMKDIWLSEEVMKFRDHLLNQDNSYISEGCRFCPIYDLSLRKE